MYGATNKSLLITPSAVGLLRIPALTPAGYVDVKCYYSPHFSTTLLSESDLVAATGCPKAYSGQSTNKFFDFDHDAINRDIAKGVISLEKHYSVDSGHCLVTCHHKQNRRKDLVICGIICSGQCYTQPIVLPTAKPSEPSPASNSIEDRTASLQAIYEQKEESFRALQSDLGLYHLASTADIPTCQYRLSLEELPLQALRTHSERKLWHN